MLKSPALSKLFVIYSELHESVGDDSVGALVIMNYPEVLAITVV